MSEHANNWGLIGHQRAVQLLAGRLNAGRAAHAFLISGPEGIGKSLLALKLAQAINCERGTIPCGECRTCDLLAREGHIDLRKIQRDGASIRIEAIRDLQSFLMLKPYEARFRIGWIEGIEGATPAAMDALLKTLEEPPAGSKLILTASDPERLLATVVSRCQHIILRPVASAQVEAALRARTKVSAEAARLIAGLSGGRPGLALRLAEDPAALALRQERIGQIIGALSSSRLGRFAYAEMLSNLDRTEREAALAEWETWWRDVLMLAEGAGVPLVNVDYRATLEQIAQQAGREGARRGLRVLRDTVGLLAATNVSARLALEVMFLELPVFAQLVS